MENLTTTLEKITALAIKYSGSQPMFRISQNKDAVEIVDASSWFLKMVFAQDKVCASLHNGVISVNFFK